MKSSLFYFFCFVLIAVGLIGTYGRSYFTQVPIFSDLSETVWIVEAKVEFEANNESVRATLNIPTDPPGFEVIQEQTSSAGFGFAYEGEDPRQAVWTKRDAVGKETLYYKAQFKQVAFKDKRVEQAPSVGAHKTYSGAKAIAANSVIEEAKKLSSDTHSFVRELLRIVNKKDDQNINILLSDDKKEKVVHNLLSGVAIASRIVQGVQLEDARRNQQTKPYIEIYSDKRWHLFDLQKGYLQEYDDLLLWSRNDPWLLMLEGGNNSKVSFSMIEKDIPSIELAREYKSDSLFHIFSVTSLPVEEQGMFKTLLILPLGALMVVFLRIFVGLKTSGTFMPVLIAVAFMQTSFVSGLVSFVLIVIFGLMIRTYLSYLNLLMVARISAIIVIVVFLVGLLSALGYKLGYNTGMSVAFFPIIIISWTIERMSIVWEEEGPNEVLIQGIGSLIVASLAYFVMSIDFLNHLTFNFPEINLVVLGIILLLGRYSGYRLSEFYRFRNMDFDKVS
ncbi:MAG: inactive transglutaminase family protein [Campylobacterota bacterium]